MGGCIAMLQRWVVPASIEAEIDRVRSLGLDALRKSWQAAFGRSPASALSKDIIGRMIAWRISGAGNCLDGLARRDGSASGERRHLKTGTVLVRDYQGERHTVTIVADGFLW